MTRLEPGALAPAFTLLDDHGDKVALRSYKGTPVILYAYPAAMTPGCTTQACDFRDSLASLTKAGYAVLGISPDPVEKLAEFLRQLSRLLPSDDPGADADVSGLELRRGCLELRRHHPAGTAPRRPEIHQHRPGFL